MVNPDNPKTLEGTKASKNGIRVSITKQDEKTIHGKMFFRDSNRVWYVLPFKVDKVKLKSI